MYTFIVIVITIICALLTLVVLLQSGDGNGISAMGAGASTQMMGTRRTSDILSKSTTYLATAFLTLCVIANFFIVDDTPQRSVIQSNAPLAVPSELPTSGNATQPSQSNSALPTENENDKN